MGLFSNFLDCWGSSDPFWQNEAKLFHKARWPPPAGSRRGHDVLQPVARTHDRPRRAANDRADAGPHSAQGAIAQIA